MSCIRSTLNVKNQEWLIQKISLQPTFTDIEIVVVSEGEFTEFKGQDFKYGFTLSFANEIIIQEDYPPTGVKYELVSRDPICRSKVNLLPDHNYTFEVYADINDVRIEKIITFLTEKPPQPFPSWTWNGLEWVAPIQMPSQFAWEWNESDQMWTRIILPTETS